MRPDVVGRTAPFGHPALSRWLAATVCLVILSATACSSLPEAEVEGPQGREFLSLVPDSVDDVGLGSEITVDGEGLPYISYLGFTAQLAEGEIPVARPVGAPFLQTEDGEDAGAVLLASLTADQIWNRGAVAQARETPAGVTVPFGPAAEPTLTSMTPGSAEGTDIDVAGTDIHVAWTANTGVWYGVGPDFELETIEETREAGSPSIVVDGSGVPLVAYTMAGARPQVRLAERVDDAWRIGPVTTLSACGEGCPPATEVGLLGGEPIVVVADARSGELIAARQDGETWATEVIATGVTGGASLATSEDTATVAFYTASGVSVASGRFGEWATEDVASTAGGADEAASREPTTGVAVDDGGTTWVTWEDGEGIHLASGAEGGEFEAVELPDMNDGTDPSVAVAADGASVYLAWYDAENADLRVGIYGEVADLLIAAPSPTAAAVAPGIVGCGDEGQPILDIVALGTAFDPQCLVAPAGEPFTLTLDNQDPAPIQHNLEVYTEQNGEQLGGTEIASGPITQPLDLEPLEEGDYFFQCVVHASIPAMTGTLAVVEAGGGGNGGGGGGG
jgi:hypothetical protein